MKIKIERKFLQRVLDFYTNELMNKFHGKLFTPALKYRIQDELRNIQLMKQSMEPLNSFWFIDVKVIYGDRNNFDVDIAEPDQVEIV
jgi:hypothetical protein